eukprot:GHVL01021931.1.p1 GENE.GHVL01021931.1~~GHVL01021931.1.p1  ORF type:complete len:109 (-),score=22.32 GHVL01021931.1:169-495(-)
MAQSGISENGVPVSNFRSRIFYVNTAKKVLFGSKEKEPQSEVIITGLGTAINAAVGVSDRLIKQNVVTMSKVETSYHTSSDNSTRPLPKITIWLTKNPDYKDEEPATE